MKNQTTKRHTTFRKAERAKRGKRHVYQAPPAPRVKPDPIEREAQLRRQRDERMAEATLHGKALMAQWS